MISTLEEEQLVRPVAGKDYQNLIQDLVTQKNELVAKLTHERLVQILFLDAVFFDLNNFLAPAQR